MSGHLSTSYSSLYDRVGHAPPGGGNRETTQGAGMLFLRKGETTPMASLLAENPAEVTLS